MCRVQLQAQSHRLVRRSTCAWSPGRGGQGRVPDVHVEGAGPGQDARPVDHELGAAGGGDHLRQGPQGALERFVPVARDEPGVSVLVVRQPVELVRRLLHPRLHSSAMAALRYVEAGCLPGGGLRLEGAQWAAQLLLNTLESGYSSQDQSAKPDDLPGRLPLRQS